MQLVDEIINLAIDESSSLSALLRKCLVLAYQLKADKLKIWVEGELNGYEEKDLPPYRIISTVAKGSFNGPAGIQLNDYPIPGALLEKEHRRFADTAYLSQPIAAYEKLMLNENANPYHQWPTNLVLLYQRKLMPGYYLVDARIEVPASIFVGLIDSVRNKVLKFALELKDELGLVNNDLKKISPETVDRNITVNVYGGTNIIADSIHNINQYIDSVQMGDIQSLLTSVESIGFSANEVQELKSALIEDGKESEVKKIGEKTNNWLSKIKGTTFKLGEIATKAVVEAAIKNYLGA